MIQYNYKIKRKGSYYDQISFSNGQFGDLIPLDEMGDFISYDGHGYYCKQEGDTTYKSNISYNADYPAPKMLSEAFTHVLWYNR